MTQARLNRLAATLPPARLLGSLLLGGALAFSAAQWAQAASASATAKAASTAASSPASDDDACPWHGGKHEHKRHHRHEAGHGRGMTAMGGGMGLPFAGPGLDRLLDEVQASDAQRKQIAEIQAKTRADLRALHEQGHAKGPGAMAIWAAPQIDAAEAEKQRQQMLVHHDRVSQRMMQAMLDVGRVLTPEQRAKAAAAIEQRRERRENRQGREDARRAGDDDKPVRLHNHKLRRPAAVVPVAPSQPASSR